MTPLNNQEKSLGWIVAAAVFALDLQTQLGFAVPMLYVLPILLTRYISGWRATVFLTGGVVVLAWAGLMVSLGDTTYQDVGNRTLASWMTWETPRPWPILPWWMR